MIGLTVVNYGFPIAHLWRCAVTAVPAVDRRRRAMSAGNCVEPRSVVAHGDRRSPRPRCAGRRHRPASSGCRCCSRVLGSRASGTRSAAPPAWSSRRAGQGAGGAARLSRPRESKSRRGCCAARDAEFDRPRRDAWRCAARCATAPHGREPGRCAQPRRPVSRRRSTSSSWTSKPARAPSAMMQPLVADLSDQDMRDLAAYYAYLPRLPAPDRAQCGPPRRSWPSGAPMRNIAALRRLPRRAGPQGGESVARRPAGGLHAMPNFAPSPPAPGTTTSTSRCATLPGRWYPAKLRLPPGTMPANLNPAVTLDYTSRTRWRLGTNPSAQSARASDRAPRETLARSAFER